MDRRRFLKTSAAASAGLVVAGRLPETLVARAGQPQKAPFLHGVASGDPLPDRTILWTRVTPTKEAAPGSGKGPNVTVRWEVAEDRGFSKVVRSGAVRTGPAVDHTVKLDVGGLAPDTEYFYRFRAHGAKSPTGRTKTAASPTAENAGLRFGVVSCSNYEGGYFTAYRYLAEREDLDLVLHLGDYIYEYAPGGYGPGPDIDRVHEPDHEIVSLADYRIRHALYKTDPDLQALHAHNPFITIWDDHEVANNTYKDGAENHQPEEEGDYIKRRNDAYRAYFEWMPIRELSDPNRSFRDFQFGNLVDLHMLDLRQYRDQEASSGQDPAKDDAARTITGDKQMDWLLGGLEDRRARWRIVGNQVMFMPWETGPDQPFNVDAWDGYRPDRQQVLQHLVDNEIDNVVFLTGDIHSSWAADVPLDPDTYPASPSVCTELVCTSVTSDNLDDIVGSPPRSSSLAVEEAIKATNRHIKEVEFDSHGYSVVDVSRERLQMDWYYISDREDPEATQAFGQAWQIEAGSNAVTPAEEPIPSR
jgi:alkaline phosphatase D